MNAEIFYLKHHEMLLSPLKALLRRHIYSAIQLSLHEIQIQSGQQDKPEMAWRYVKLLQASIPPERGLRLQLNQVEFFGYRFYIEVYYPLSGQPYSRETFHGDRLAGFFPAVALRERMVLIPKGLGNRLATRSMYPFNPLEMGGVLEVDFGGEAELEKAVTQVGQTLRADFLREMRAYASYQSLRDINLPQLSQDLGVDVGFIQHSLKAEAGEATYYGQLTCRFDQERLPLNRWTKVALTIQNESDVDLNDLAVEIDGPVQIRPGRVQASIPAHSSREVPLALMPQDRGDFPLEITFVLSDDRLSAEWLPVHHIWLQAE